MLDQAVVLRNEFVRLYVSITGDTKENMDKAVQLYNSILTEQRKDFSEFMSIWSSSTRE